MIAVTKDEAEYLRSKINNVRIFKTCKMKSTSKRGVRYAEETSSVVRLLSEYRNAEVVHG